MTNQTIKYSSELDIRNVASLPKGTGCRYLLCIRGESNEYIAKQWKRSRPNKVTKLEVVIEFK
jgi:hypothetical protein